MRGNSQSRVAQTDNHTDDTLGSLSTSSGVRTVEITDQETLEAVGDGRFFEAESEPRTAGPVAASVEYPEFE